MDILEMAKILGTRIREEESVKALEEAKKAYEASEELSQAILEYNVQQQILEGQRDLQNKDEELIASVDARINELYARITENEVFKNYENRQAEVDALIRSVIETIVSTVNGDEHKHCTHDCSTCGGCSH